MLGYCKICSFPLFLNDGKDENYCDIHADESTFVCADCEKRTSISDEHLCAVCNQHICTTCWENAHWLEDMHMSWAGDVEY